MSNAQVHPRAHGEPEKGDVFGGSTPRGIKVLALGGFHGLPPLHGGIEKVAAAGLVDIVGVVALLDELRPEGAAQGGPLALQVGLVGRGSAADCRQKRSLY